MSSPPRRWARAAARAARTCASSLGATAQRSGHKIRAIASRPRRRREWNDLSYRVGALRLPDFDDRARDVVCFTPATTRPLDRHWRERLAAALTDDIVAATPQVLHPLRRLFCTTPLDGRVRARGLDIEVQHDAPAIVARGAGSIPTLDDTVESVAAAPSAALVVDRRALDDAGGLPDATDRDAAVLDVCRRLRARGGRIVVVPSAVVVDDRSPAAEAAARRAYVEQNAPALMREAAPLPPGTLRIAITVAAPSEKVAARWGDWHLAHAFARALRTLGHDVRVQTFDQRDAPSARACDVHCVIRGLRAVSRAPGQPQVMWIISHPDTVEVAECDRADLVLVASARFADVLRARTRTPVEVMLQATDTTRFRPMPRDTRHEHDVVVVAKSRDVYRGSVRAAIAAGVRPAIYGSGWEQFVDRSLIVSDYVANDELAAVYSSAGVVLNDHWDDMRSNGFVSNRIFDALACVAPVISDDMPEIRELFGDTVLTYRDGELRALVDCTLADRDAATRRAERGRKIVVAGHTFDHRARQFVDALLRHGLHPNP